MSSGANKNYLEEFGKFFGLNIIPSKKRAKLNYVEVPSIGIAVPKKETFFDYPREMIFAKVHSKNQKILTPCEYIEFLKTLEKTDYSLYKDIVFSDKKGKTELLDASFIKHRGKFVMIYHTFEKGGYISQKAVKLDKDTLLDENPKKISFDSWILDHTPQGLPKKLILEGDMYYYSPKKGNDSVGGIERVYNSICLNLSKHPNPFYPQFFVRQAVRM